MPSTTRSALIEQHTMGTKGAPAPLVTEFDVGTESGFLKHCNVSNTLVLVEEKVNSSTIRRPRRTNQKICLVFIMLDVQWTVLDVQYSSCC